MGSLVFGIMICLQFRSKEGRIGIIELCFALITTVIVFTQVVVNNGMIMLC